jgi:hypothetical protein
MKLAESTYNAYEIENFLFENNKKFAATAWYMDMIGIFEGERVPQSAAEKWFTKFFPANENQYMFRLMQSHCTATSEIIE